MDKVKQWLCPQEVALDLDVPNRREALRAVGTIVERSHGLSAPLIFRALWRRELAASTAIGNGFAIPHARITGITEPVTVYVRTRTPLDFGASDRKRTVEFYAILVPANGDNARHLQLLAQVAEVCADRNFRVCLAAASSPQEVRSVFSQWIAMRHADAAIASSGPQHDAGVLAH